MADVRVTTTGNRRVTTTGDVRVTEEGLETLITFSQSVRRYNDASTLVTFDQRVGVFNDATTLIQLEQAVRKSPVLNPASTLVTLDQTVVFVRTNAATTLVTFAQNVERSNAQTTLVTFRQRVQAEAPRNPTYIFLDGQDISDQCAPAVEISASEGANRTATVTYRPPPGPINIPGYQGRDITIMRTIGGTLRTLFVGKVDVPRYDRYQATLRLRCSDLRGERIGREDRDLLKAITGGLYSPVTQRNDATGEAWVNELMKTVPGSLDYNSSGQLKYSPWAVGAPVHTLQGSKIHYKEVELDFSTRSEIVNSVGATLEYRYFKRNTISHAVSVEAKRTDYCKLAGCTPASRVEDEDGNLVPQILPSKNALLSAAKNVSGWAVGDLEYIPLPPDGWYRLTSDVTRKISYGASELIRNTRAMGANVTLERYISQPKRETYSLSITAPQSIDQYGEVEGGDMRFALETRVDPSVFEERGCSVVTDPDDRRSDVNSALTIIQRMGERIILESHRKNYVNVRYKPGNGVNGERELLPVEIGQTIQAIDDEVTTIGNVTEFQHVVSGEDAWTDIKLAVSRVDSAVTVTEDWTLPAAPTKYVLNADSQSLPATPDCPVPEGEVQVTGESRLEPDGTVIIVAPSVDRSNVDEIQGERQKTYNVEIPNNTLDVEVAH